MLIPVKTMTVFAPAKQSYTGTPDRSIPVNNHRLRWIENRIRILWSLFAIEICSFPVMSNPIYLVVKLMPQEAQSWTEVLDNDFHVCLTELPFLNDMIYTYNQTKTTSS
jgi:hypothetical protein